MRSRVVHIALVLLVKVFLGKVTLRPKFTLYKTFRPMFFGKTFSSKRFPAKFGRQSKYFFLKIFFSPKIICFGQILFFGPKLCEQSWESGIALGVRLFGIIFFTQQVKLNPSSSRHSPPSSSVNLTRTRILT